MIEVIMTPGTPETRRKKLEKVAEFIGANSVEYVDLGRSERYTFTLPKGKLHINVNGNGYDGAFANFSVGGEE